MLLTRDDLSVKRRHLGVRATLERLLKADIVPVINENDCISVDELKFGDNDILSALVASLTKADLLVLLSTIPGLMNLATGEVISLVTELSDSVLGLAQGTTSPTAVGGMVSKLNAAKIATASQCGMFIASGKEEGILLKLLGGEPKGTFFVPQGQHLPAHKRWLAFFKKGEGFIHVDAGAGRALIEQGRSLLAKGVQRVDGNFKEGTVVEVIDVSGKAIARGIAQYDSAVLSELCGLASQEIRDRFPERKHLEVIHRDGMVLLH
jgi:glutamate 5-kinase